MSETFFYNFPVTDTFFLNFTMSRTIRLQLLYLAPEIKYLERIQILVCWVYTNQTLSTECKRKASTQRQNALISTHWFIWEKQKSALHVISTNIVYLLSPCGRRPSVMRRMSCVVNNLSPKNLRINLINQIGMFHAGTKVIRRIEFEVELWLLSQLKGEKMKILKKKTVIFSETIRPRALIFNMWHYLVFVYKIGYILPLGSKLDTPLLFTVFDMFISLYIFSLTWRANPNKTSLGCSLYKTQRNLFEKFDSKKNSCCFYNLKIKKEQISSKTFFSKRKRLKPLYMYLVRDKIPSGFLKKLFKLYS